MSRVRDHFDINGHRFWALFDTGARNAADVAALGISVGDPIVPVSEFAVLPNNRYLAKAWDDRVGCIAMIEAMRMLEQNVASAEDINTAMRLGFNWPAGPLEMVAGARKGWQ